jgi:hypothetical protein
MLVYANKYFGGITMGKKLTEGARIRVTFSGGVIEAVYNKKTLDIITMKLHECLKKYCTDQIACSKCEFKLTDKEKLFVDMMNCAGETDPYEQYYGRNE